MNKTILLSSGLWLLAQAPATLAVEPPLPPVLNDPELKLELVASFPEVETPTTVTSSPDGTIFIGNDPRDSRLSTVNPECTIVRYSSLGADRKRTVFADKLFSPAGMLWHDGWLYVIHDPLMTRFKDTNGDGIADVREDLITNLGIEPNEGLNDHVVSGFTLGMDGFFYISVGDRGIYHAKGKDGSEVTLLGGGIVRCRPDGTALEVYSGGTRNHLEVNLDAMDRPFTLDNTDDGNGWWTRLEYHVESGYYGYPYYYRKDQTNGLLAPGPNKAQPFPDAPAVNERFLPSLTDFGGGSPTGGLCYMSDGLPEKYRGKQLFSEWGQRRLSVIEVAQDGAGFKHVNNQPLLEESKGGSFRPMELYVGHDGSLLVADWGFGGWKSPKSAGAVWRVSWPEAHPAQRLAYPETAAVKDLVAALNHPDRDQRLRAEWALVRHGGAAFEAVAAVAKDSAAPELQRAHALWTLDLLADASKELRKKTTAQLVALLKDSDPEIRAQSVRALATRWVRSAAGDIATLLHDANAQVRLQAAIALGRIGAPEHAAALVPTLGDSDRWVRFVARAALVKLRGWAQAAPLLKSGDAVASEQAWLLFTDVADVQAVAVLTKLVSDSDPVVRAKAATALGQAAYLPKEWDGHWWATQPVKNPAPLNSVAWEGTPLAIATLKSALADNDSIVRLATAKSLGYGLGEEALPALRERLTLEKDPAVRRQLIETLGVQKDSGALTVFSKIALDEKADADFRETAILAVANIGGEEARKMIALIMDANLSAAATLKVVQTAGEMKVIEAAPALKRHVLSDDKTLRMAAIKSLAALGPKAEALETFVAALKDKDGAVVNAALEAISSLHDLRGLPALLDLAKQRKPNRELIAALASVTDPETIPFLVKALREGNSGVRRTASGALKKMREQSWPLIEQDIASGSIPAEFVPEIRMAFESGIIAKWKVIGPFENVWGAVHPPEKEALAAQGKPDLKASHTNAEGADATWTELSTAAQDGAVNLGRFFKNEGMVCAYAYTEIDSSTDADAKLFCGSDDQIALWLNGTKIHDFGGSRALNPDGDEVAIHLKAGTNRLLVKIGNLNGTWQFAARIPGLDGTKFVQSKEPSPDIKQRAYALTTKPDGNYVHAGDATRGEKIFRDQSGPLGGICANCHMVNGVGGVVGPDLSAIAMNYKRADLITSIHEPSKTIALGFEQFLISTNAGEVFAGAIRQETSDSITVLGVDAQPHEIKKTDIKSRTPVATSLMPAGLTLGLKPEEFVDLLAYLEKLKPSK